MRVALAILTFNERLGLEATFGGLPLRCVDYVFAVDAHSADGTPEYFASRGVRVYPQREPGLGAAMLEARQRADAEAVIFFHPDGNEDPADVERIAALLRLGAEFVVASRMIPGAWNEEDVSAFRPRKWANRGLALLAHLLFNRKQVRFTDITNGLRGVSCATFDRMRLDRMDLTMDFQMIIRALKLGIPITEFPTIEGRRVAGVTHFNSLPTGLANLRLLLLELVRGDRVFGRSGEQ